MPSHRPNILRGLRWAIPAVALAFGLVVLGIAAAAPAVTAPTVLTHPADPTNQTSASFTYNDSQAGVTYQCQIDAGGFNACPATGTSYTSLAQGNHTFAVRAVSGTKTSTATTFTWLVDLTTPTATLTFPAEGGIYSASAYNGGCPGAGICGKANDIHHVSSVAISIQKAGGSWWGGTSFNKTSETFLATTVETPGSNNTGWRYPLSLPADGNYIVHVRATDEAGNVTPAESQASATFTVDTAPPPVPTVTSGPELETVSHTETFTFTDSEPGVTFLCAKDERVYYACTSPKSYETPNPGEHAFTVEARDAAGNVSALASYSWTITTVKALTVEGNLVGQLFPGATRPLALVLGNPNTHSVVITSLKAAAAEHSSKTGCDGPANLAITQSNISEANPLPIPAHGSVTLPSGSFTAPQVLMKNLPTNQDACKGATFTFNYTDSGHS